MPFSNLLPCFISPKMKIEKVIFYISMVNNQWMENIWNFWENNTYKKVRQHIDREFNSLLISLDYFVLIVNSKNDVIVKQVQYPWWWWNCRFWTRGIFISNLAGYQCITTLSTHKMTVTTNFQTVINQSILA